MDMKQLLALVSEKLEDKQTEECGMPMSTPAVSSTPPPPVSMTVNMNAQGSDQIKELLKLISNAEEKPTEMPVQIAMSPEESKLANSPADTGMDEPMTAPLDAAIPSGDDLHKKKGAYPKVNGGDNPMAIENIKTDLRALYKTIKEA